MKFAVVSIVPLLATFAALVSGDCPEVAVQENFDLDAYISAPWYVQEQAVVEYLPRENFFCVRAQYSKVGGWFKQTFWGYTIRVDNQARDAAGNPFGGGLCAYQTNSHEEPAKLAVAPCFLPTFLAGPYWVLAFEEGENGYALISGGQPTIDTGNGCVTGDGINNSGLWVFTRAKERNEEVVAKVRDIAVAKGFDISVLEPVEQANCEYDGGRRLGNQLRG
ncbi:hypothetical protein ACA910_016776 [Epithemia clementina (nom. ined.)]